MRRRVPILLVILALSLAQTLVAKGSSVTRTSRKSTNDGTVTQRLKMSYNSFHCADGVTERIQITLVATRYTRKITNRKVSVSHVTGAEVGHNCNNGGVNVSQTVSWNPVFGCGGRCQKNTTEEQGFAPSWPYIIIPSPGSIFVVGSAGHGHITDGSGNPLTTICDQLGFSGVTAPGCQ
jgi:hypothetical protein